MTISTANSDVQTPPRDRRHRLFHLSSAGRFSLRHLAVNVLPLPALNAFYRATNPKIPDRDGYVPLFSPWRTDPAFLQIFGRILPRTLVDAPRCWALYCLARQSLHVPGCFLEAGVYKGGTAALLRSVLETEPSKHLHLFDTFEGLPEVDGSKDLLRRGDFNDTSLEGVRQFVGSDRISYHKGLIPSTFTAIETESIAFAHVDVDLFSSVLACCQFIYPRLSPGGVMVFDDYGYPTCPGAREAVDAFFAGKPEIPLVNPTGQAFVFKLPWDDDEDGPDR